jgi:hypothetical protein
MNTEKYSGNPYFVPPADFDPVTEGIRLRVEASKHYAQLNALKQEIWYVTI